MALTLRLLGGLTTEEIARAFLVPEATIAQRIVRAKRTLAEAQVPFEVPARGPSCAARLSSVLEVIYLVFNEGYSATAGDDWMRPALCEDALRLGRILAGLLPDEPEVHGLVALMEIQASRLPRPGRPVGEPSCCSTGPPRWDHVLIRRGLAALERADALGGGSGPYALQAAIAACHARARDGGGDRLGAHRRPLRRARPAGAVARRRAQPRGRRRDGVRPGGGLELVDALIAEPALARLPPAARACAATCSRSSAASTRRAPSSSARRRSRATRASASCSSSAPPTSGADGGPRSPG